MSRSTSVRSAFVALLVLLALAIPAFELGAQVPHPRDVFGFTPGDDYQIADYAQMLEYYRRLDAASDRVVLREIGTSVRGKPMLLLYISSEENLRQLDRWRSISERLARARIDEPEARRLAGEGRAIVWIDGGMHSTERAHAQMTSLLAYRVATEETAEMRAIRDNVVLLLMPVMNPDGLDIVAHWYHRNRGTPFETTGPPELYQHYVGHDNNRDWYMHLQPETQAVSRVLYEEWYPQIVYNHHQTSPRWTRIFTPPFADPVNPDIPAGVISGVNLVGNAMINRFMAEGKDGVISRLTFDMWWNGGMRTAPYYHNMIGILTETAHPSPTPEYYPPEQLPATVGGRRAGDIPTDRPTMFYPAPWRGGWLRFADAVEYMLTASMAVLDVGAKHREDWLYGIWRMGRESIERGRAGGPFAYVIPAQQWDRGEARELVNVLRRGGVEVLRATRDFTAEGRQFRAGDWIVPAAQAFRPHVVNLLEPQVYPDRRMYEGGPPEPPYDLAGWTLPIQMGVDVVRIERETALPGEPVDRAAVAPGRVTGAAGFGWAIGREQNQAVRAANRLLAAGDRVYRARAPFDGHGAGTYVVEAGSGTADRIQAVARELGIDAAGLARRPAVELETLRAPRVAMYQSWVPNMDEGWTRWLLEQYEFDLTSLRDADIRNGDLSRFDVVILPSDNPSSMMHGHPPGTMPAEYTGGLGVEGALALKRFVEAGGTVVALDDATGFAIEQFSLPVRDVVRGVADSEFFIPGSLIAIRNDVTHPLAHGMREEGAAFFVRSRAFDIVRPASANDRRAAPPPVEVVTRYASDDLVLSGWALGERRFLAGRPAVVTAKLGTGEVVLIGFRAQMRGQPRNTFKLLFNALQGAAAAGPERVSQEEPEPASAAY
jgi:hypothetical protein